jgi:hypothetical protein
MNFHDAPDFMGSSVGEILQYAGETIAFGGFNFTGYVI